MKRPVILTSAIALCVALAGAAAWLMWRRPDVRRPDIVLIVVDTLRRDHVGAYGYPRPTTPAIDALAAENVIFANAYANANWTKPSVASLLTGLYVSQHGVTHVVTSAAGQPPMTQKLPDEVTTLAETMRSAGYRTIGVVDNVHLSAKLGFSQGFQTWNENCHGANMVTQDALSTLNEAKGPFFMYVHYFDAHAPYNRTRLVDSRGSVAPEVIESDSTDLRWSTYTYGVDRGIIGLSPVERERLVELYDGEVRTVDTGVARILATLKARGLYDNAWIVVTADHGENFYESKRLVHPHDCFSNPQLRVPLIMKMPSGLGVKERVVADQVELVDVAPTMMGYLGMAPLPGMAGVNLMPAIAEHQTIAGRAIPAESDGGRMLLADGYKYVDVPTSAGEFKFVYNESRDPLEEHDLASAEPALLARLSEKSAEVAAQARGKLAVKASSGVALSAEELEKMKALGYLH